jgi:hypothetical protein
MFIPMTPPSSANLTWWTSLELPDNHVTTNCDTLIERAAKGHCRVCGNGSIATWVRGSRAFGFDLFFLL